MLSIIRTIWEAGGTITRPEIAKLTKLTTMTVTTLVAELEDLEIVVPSGIQPSKGGRKAVLYKLNCDKYLIASISLQLERAVIELFDLCGQKDLSVNVPLFNKEINKSIEEIIDALKKLLKNRADKIVLGIGITVPGRVEYGTGSIHSLTNLPNWHNVPLKHILEKELQIPTFLERDTNAHVTCLKLSRLFAEMKNVVYIAIDEGVGAGVLLNGQVLRGAHGIAGEVGHISLETQGALCNCGSRGCVETYASNSSIIKFYSENSPQNSEAKSVLGNRSLENDYIIKLLKLANTEKEAKDAFLRAIKYLSFCLIAIINTYDPLQIVVECKWMREDKKYFQLLLDNTFQNFGFLQKEDINILLNPIEQIFGISAYMVVMERIFDDVKNNVLLSKERL